MKHHCIFGEKIEPPEVTPKIPSEVNDFFKIKIVPEKLKHSILILKRWPRRD